MSDPKKTIATIDDAISACYGQEAETSINGKTATMEWEPAPASGVQGTAKGYVMNATVNYVSTSLPMYFVAGDGLLIVTNVISGAGERVSDEEFAQLTQAAADTARG